MPSLRLIDEMHEAEQPRHKLSSQLGTTRPHGGYPRGFFDFSVCQYFHPKVLPVGETDCINSLDKVCFS